MTSRRNGPASSLTTPPADALPPDFGPGLTADQALVLGSKEYEGCFGCGEAAPNGLRIQRTGFDGRVSTAWFVVEEWHQGAPGLAHGGLLTAAMDEALGTAAWLLGGRYVTGRLETDFLAPVPVGSKVYLRSWCAGVAGRKVYVEAEGAIGAPDGILAVRAAALFVEVPAEHFSRAREAG